MEFSKISQKVCSMCGSIKQKKNFYPSITQDNEYLPICKDCIERMLAGYKQAFEDRETTFAEVSAIWCVLFQLNLPFYRDLVMEAQDKASNNIKMTFFEIYYTLLKNSMRKFTSTLDGDTNMTELFVMFGKKNEDSESLSDAEKSYMLSAWGKYSVEDWRWLENKYHEYTSEILNLEKAGEELYRQLCKDDLRLRQAFESGEDTKAITDEKFKIMKLLGIDKFASNESSETEKHIERLAWKFENTEPAELEDKSIYKDVAGYEKMYHEIMRSQENFIRGSKNYPAIPKEEQ